MAGFAIPPDPITFYLSTPLYAKFSASVHEVKQIIAIKNPSKTLDSHCMTCQRESVFDLYHCPGIGYLEGFRTETEEEQWREEIVKDQDFYIVYMCTRCKFKLTFFCHLENQSIQKQGQFPSLADLQLADVLKYRIVMEPEKYSEFTKAIGLAAHGVGVGSFVYLRRIFETLVEEAHQEAVSDPGWDEAEFNGSRMAEKIGMLTHHLPDFLVKNKKIYGILSKGIHELSEQECLAHFEPLKIGIELILEEHLERKEKEDKIKKAPLAIEKINAQ